MLAENIRESYKVANLLRKCVTDLWFCVTLPINDGKPAENHCLQYIFKILLSFFFIDINSLNAVFLKNNFL